MKDIMRGTMSFMDYLSTPWQMYNIAKFGTQLRMMPVVVISKFE